MANTPWNRALEKDARHLLLIPCCYAAGASSHLGPQSGRSAQGAGEVPGQASAQAWSARVPLPRHGLVGRRFSQAIIDAERTLRLESHGWQTEVVEVFAPTISPYNLLWRARRGKEPVRMAEARARHDELTRS